VAQVSEPAAASAQVSEPAAASAQVSEPAAALAQVSEPAAALAAPVEVVDAALASAALVLVLVVVLVGAAQDAVESGVAPEDTEPAVEEGGVDGARDGELAVARVAADSPERIDLPRTTSASRNHRVDPKVCLHSGPDTNPSRILVRSARAGRYNDQERDPSIRRRRSSGDWGRSEARSDPSNIRSNTSRG